MPASPRSGVLVVGESLVDITTAGDETSVHPGGSPLNVAVGLSRLGVPTTLATQLGHDAYGDLIRAHLAASSVTLMELVSAGPTGTATAQLDADGAASYTFELHWDPPPVALPAGFDLLHVGSLAAALMPGAEMVATLVREARRAGVAVSLDPNIRTAVTPDLGEARRRVLDLAVLADVVKLSDDDAAVLFAGQSHDAVLDELLATGGPGMAVLTRGGAGALLATGQARASVPAASVAVADSIGAGDSFTAALLSALPDGAHLAMLDRDALIGAGTFACRAAAITCSRPGADPPWRSELEHSTRSAATCDDSYARR